MADRKALSKDAKKLVAATEGALGRRTMQLAVREHLDLFERLRGDGATWDQIAAFLYAAGLRTKTASKVTGGVLRVLVARAQQEARRTEPRQTVIASEVRRPVISMQKPAPASRAAGQEPARANEIAERMRRAAKIRKGEAS